MKSKVFYPLICILGMCISYSCQSAVKTEDDPTLEGAMMVKIDPSQKLAPVNQLFWGSNFLFWVEDDASLADGKIEEAMKNLPVRILRYPGGTVADNFHWATNTLDNPYMFPYEEGEEQSDFDEFMSFCSRVGAEPMLVVNTQSWYLKQDIEGGAAEAASWVQYCIDKGYKVKYWEIGNETYWHTVMTAKEYGHLANIYAKAMKSVDPTIVVSVNGGWDINMSGNKERTDPSFREEARKAYLSISSVEESKIIKEEIESHIKKPWTASEDKWWDGLISVCGDNIDMVSVHWYYHDNVIKHIDKKLLELKAFLKEKKPNKDYLFCLSEYNCNTDVKTLRVTGFAESIGRFLNVGTDISCFWPFRIGGRATDKNGRSMLSLDDKEVQYPYRIFSMLQEDLKGNMVACSHPENLYAYASVSDDNTTVVLSGRCLTEATKVAVDAGRIKRAEIEVTEYAASKEGLNLISSDKEWTKTTNTLIFELKPETFVIIRIRNKKLF